MTNVEFSLDKGNIVSFKVEGHSGYSEKGTDIVCAAVSSAVWMTVNALENILKLEIEYSQDDGRVHCSVSGKDAERAGDFMEALRQFLCNLSSEYGKYLTVKEVQRNV